MASRPRGYGMTAELAHKTAAKYSVEEEQAALGWIRDVVGGETASELAGVSGMKDTHAKLKNGAILCNLINVIAPGSVRKVNTSAMAFKQMENIGQFLTGCENYGINKVDLFQTVDLYESQNMYQVICTIHALGRKAQGNGFRGPRLGPREATCNPREFSPETRAAGKALVGLLMEGSNKGATQAGMSFGRTRQIMDHGAQSSNGNVEPVNHACNGDEQ